MDKNGLLTLKEAAERLGLTRNALYHWQRRGLLHMTWDPYGSRRLVLAEEVEELRVHLKPGEGRPRKRGILVSF